MYKSKYLFSLKHSKKSSFFFVFRLWRWENTRKLFSDSRICSEMLIRFIWHQKIENRLRNAPSSSKLRFLSFGSRGGVLTEKRAVFFHIGPTRFFFFLVEEIPKTQKWPSGFIFGPHSVSAPSEPDLRS